MRKLNRILLSHALVALFVATLSAQVGGSAEQQAVRRCFLDYKTAILESEGEAARQLVNEATIRYYGRMRELALRGAESEVRQLSTMDKIMVLSLRHRVEKGLVQSMAPEAVLVHGVNQGWIGKNSVLNSDVGRIIIFKNQASAEFISNGKLTPLKYRFTKENGRWRIDLTSITAIADQAMKMLIKQQKLNEDEFIISLLESVSGRKVSAEVWQPLIQ